MQADLFNPPAVLRIPARRRDPSTSKAAASVIGMQFGRLTLIAVSGERTKDGRTKVECSCSCGGRIIAAFKDIRSGSTKSCGCLQRESHLIAAKKNTRHGLTNAPEWESWQSMRRRCDNPMHKSFALYGGRGISVCERWLVFENFLADMGPRPSGTTLDRYPDRDGNYEPGNCRWATNKEQQRNRRSNRPITAFGETKLVVEWSEDPRCAVSHDALAKRLDAGWPAEAAMSMQKYATRSLPKTMRPGLARPTGETEVSQEGRSERQWKAVA